MTPGERWECSSSRISFYLLNAYWPSALPGIYCAFGVLLKRLCDSTVPAVDPGHGQDLRRVWPGDLPPDRGPDARARHPAGARSPGVPVFIADGNNFLLPPIIIIDDAKQTLPDGANDPGPVQRGVRRAIRGVIISIVPVPAVFAVTSKKVIGRISFGGLKG